VTAFFWADNWSTFWWYLHLIVVWCLCKILLFVLLWPASLEQTISFVQQILQCMNLSSQLAINDNTVSSWGSTVDDEDLKAVVTSISWLLSVLCVVSLRLLMSHALPWSSTRDVSCAFRPVYVNARLLRYSVHWTVSLSVITDHISGPDRVVSLVCVCVCVCQDNNLQTKDLWPRYLEYFFTLTLSRPSSEVRVIGLSLVVGGKYG